eukprot:g37882.t1
MNVSWLGPTPCSCGAQIPGNKVDCPSCGKPKPKKEVQDFSQKIDKTPTKCLECGRVNEYGVQSCPDCGTTPGSKYSGAVYDQAYDTKKGDMCKGCNNQILSSVLEAMGAHWHKECFVCQSCQQALTGSFTLYDGKPLCGECQQKQQAKPKATAVGKFCTSCGAQGTSKFCMSCGTKM